MLTKEKLGQAIAQAVKLKIESGKAKSKAEIARHFGIKPPSLADWEKKGTISKEKLAELFSYFSDVVPSEHWSNANESSHQSAIQKFVWPQAFTGQLSDLEDWISSIKTQKPEAQDEHPVTSKILQAIQNLEEIASNECRIPLLSAVGSMGPGEDLTYEGDQIIQFMPVSTTWIQDTLKIKPENLRVVTGAGDSMKPTFSHGDLLLVDISKTEVRIDGVYAMSAHKRLFIKRVRQRMDGSFEVSSDNPTVKTVDVLNGEHEVTVHGRVVWAWNGSKL